MARQVVLAMALDEVNLRLALDTSSGVGQALLVGLGARSVRLSLETTVGTAEMS
jgi:hypothetical protein